MQQCIPHKYQFFTVRLYWARDNQGMNDCALGHDSALLRLYWAGDNLGTTGAKKNFVMNHAPGAGSIPRPVGQKSSTLPLYYRCPLSQLNRTVSSINVKRSCNYRSNLESVHQVPISTGQPQGMQIQ